MSDQYSFEDREDAIVLSAAWIQVLKRFEDVFPSAVMRRFITVLKPKSLVRDVAVFVAPGQFIMEWVKGRYVDQLAEALSDELGRPVKLELASEGRDRTTPQVVRATIATAVSDTPTFQPNRKFRFETFIVGQSNRMAHAGAVAVSNKPGEKYNPLFIYGNSGLGKTHLLHSIANAILDREPGFHIRYITAQQFAEDFISALQNNRVDQFRRHMRSVDLWLVDDVQFIAGKEKTQEELFHTFNNLRDGNKHVVLCSDRPPRDLHGVDERLRSRFESGLVADVQLPDTETRCAILQSKALAEGVDIAHSVALFLAEAVPGNVRTLEGALTKLIAAASLDSGELTMELARVIVDRYYPQLGNAKPGLAQILELVSRHYKIPVDEIKGVSRKAPIAHARHVAVYLVRELTGDSWKHIGAQFGNRDHTSMMHAHSKISNLLARDRNLDASVKSLLRDLGPMG